MVCRKSVYLSISDDRFIEFCEVQIFLDMAVLVDAQGEMLDNIESQVIELLSQTIILP